MAETIQDPLADLRAEFRRTTGALSVGSLGSLLRGAKTEAEASPPPLPNIRVQRSPRQLPGKLNVSFASALRRPPVRNAPIEADGEENNHGN